MGPTAIASLLTFQTTNALDNPLQHAVLLTFLTGFIELFMSIFGLGFLIDFVSGPVSSGFTSAVALIIVSTQVKDILGIKAKGATFLQIWTSVFENINTTSWVDASLGFFCICLLLILRVIGQFYCLLNSNFK